MGKLVRGVVLGLLGVILMVTPVGAAPGNPASITIGDVAVFRNLLETGDQLWFMRYDVSYATVPTERAEDTYLMAIYAPDGTTLLFTRPINYYQHNIISIYLTPAQALTWNGAYVVRIMGNPAVFGVLIEGINMRSRTLGAGDYREVTDLGTYMLQQAAILQASGWPVVLTADGVLNVTGATYFNKAIPGLSNVVPEIYMTTTEYPVVVKGNWTHSYEEDLLAKRGTSLNQTFTELGNWLGTSNNWMALGTAGFLAVMVGGGVFAATKKPDWAMIFAALTIPACVAIGVVTLSVWWIITFVILILFGVLFLMGRFA